MRIASPATTWLARKRYLFARAIMKPISPPAKIPERNTYQDVIGELSYGEADQGSNQHYSPSTP